MMKKKTVAIIGEAYLGGGKGVYPIEISKAINKISDKYKVKLFIKDTPTNNSKFIVKINPFFKTKIRIFAGLGYYLPLFFRLMNDKSIDIIHSHDERINAIMSFFKKPKIVTVCDVSFYKFPFNYLFHLLYKLLDKANYISPISNYTSNQLKKKYPFLSKKIVPIYLGVNIHRFKPSKKERKCINIGILGNLDEELSKVFKRILHEYKKEVKIIIGGEGISKEFNYLKSYPGVVFKGIIKEQSLHKHYQDIDIFVYKSPLEGFGLIPLEAMSSGCAVISSKIGSLPEVIKNGGILVNNTEKDFYGAIKKVLNNKRILLKYQKEGRKRAEELTWDKCAKKYICLYNKLK